MTHRDRFELLLLGAIWGASFLFMRIAAPEFGAVALVELRVGIAAVFLVVVMLVRGGLRELSSLAGPMALLGVTGSAFPFVLFAFATLSITAGTAAVGNATAPLFTALVAYLWLGDRLTRLQAIGLAVGFAGIVVLLQDSVEFGGKGSAVAIGACLVAALSYGFAVNYTKKRLSGVSALANATGSQIAATAMLAPLAVLYWPEELPTMRGWYCAIALGVLCTGIAYILYFRLIARIGPARAITVTYLVPVFGIFWGLVFLKEPVTLGMIGACAAIFLGVAMTTDSIRRR